MSDSRLGCNGLFEQSVDVHANQINGWPVLVCVTSIGCVVATANSGCGVWLADFI